MKFWIYMIDGIYQSLICFYMVYLLFSPATFVTSSGHNINDKERMGVFVGCAAIFVVNSYILLNTYRWDWLILLLVAISILLIWAWTGIYSQFTASGIPFYKAGSEVYGTLTFWAVTLLIVVVCLLPRFTAKAIQKIYFPRDVDIIREQVRQGHFKYLDAYDANVLPPKAASAASSDVTSSSSPTSKPSNIMNEEERPIYPPSISATATTYNARSQNGSDGTEYTNHRFSMDPTRQSGERPRPSVDRARNSMDRMRPSYEASNDFTSAALLTRLESSNSAENPRYSSLNSPLR